MIYDKEACLLYANHPALFQDEIPPVCRHFSEYLLSYEKEYCAAFHALIVCIVYAAAKSHVCFDPRFNLFQFSDSEQESTLVREAGSIQQLVLKAVDYVSKGKFETIGTESIEKPVIYHNRLFYLNKYFAYERDIARFILFRNKKTASLSENVLHDILPLLFEKNQTAQKDAVRCALAQKFCVITGGPGTGKTTTVAKILVVKKILSQSGPSPLSILLLAPTGKSASRLQQSLASGIDQMRKNDRFAPEVRQAINTLPSEVYTIHRYLRNLREEHVMHDLIVIDEFSMVDIFLFHRLLKRCTDKTDLILLGDSRQLSSVQAGSVLSDLTSTGSASMREKRVHLTHSYRFSSTGGIGKAARLITNPSEGLLVDYLESKDPSLLFIDTHRLSSLTDMLYKGLEFLNGSFDEYASYTAKGDAAESINAFNRSAILCAVRKGPLGVEMCNSVVEKKLSESGYINPRGRFYENMPLLITKNSYLLEVYNGDSGVLRSLGGKLTFCITKEGGGVRTINPVMLESWEKNYAMTIHKSQGSEFDGVIIILPDGEVPVVTRELLYTAVTRARKKAVIISSRETLSYAVNSGTVRMSGLSSLLE